MNRVFISLVIGFAVVGALLIFQTTRATSSTVLKPSELAKSAPGTTLTRIRVAGRVAADQPVDYQVQPKLRLAFSIHDPGVGPNSESTKVDPIATIPVVYQGVKPDMFTAGRDVIIDGEFIDGTLQAAQLLTQCPSKYEAPAPGAPTSAPIIVR